MNKEMCEIQADLCRIFTHPLRIRIIHVIGEGERKVCELADLLGVPQPTLSQNLALLRSEGVVVTRREGTSVYYSLSDKKLLEACRLIHQIIIERNERRRTLVENAPGPGRGRGRRERRKSPRSRGGKEA